MTHSDRSSDNDISGDVVGTSLQANSVRNVYMGESARPRWLKGLQYAAVPVAVAVTAVTITVVRSASPSQPEEEIPVAAAGSVSAEITTGPPASVVPVPILSAPAARPTQAGAAPRAPGGVTTTNATLPTSTLPKPVAPAPVPAGDGVRFSGELRFASFHLDPVPPSDVPESNLWALTPTRLHGDPGYWLAEWFAEGVPGRAECLARLGENATLDADNVVVGSRVCGKTPAGRIFRIDVTVLDGRAITGQVVVWD